MRLGLPSGCGRLGVPFARRDARDRHGVLHPRRQGRKLLAAVQRQVDLLLHQLGAQGPQLCLRLVAQLQAGGGHSVDLEGFAPHVDFLLDRLRPHRPQLCLRLGTQLQGDGIGIGGREGGREARVGGFSDMMPEARCRVRLDAGGVSEETAGCVQGLKELT